MSWWIAAALAGPIGVVPVQGEIFDGAGQALTGARTLAFALYADESAVSPLWSETRTVTLDAGMFSVQLGQVTDLDLALFATHPNVHLSVILDGAPSSRTRIGAVPYAAFSAVAATAGAVDLDLSTPAERAATIAALREALDYGALADRDAITNADVAADAAIAASKIAGLGGLASKSTITNGDISSDASISVSKLGAGAAGQFLSTLNGVVSWVALPPQLAFTPVNRAGDTMTGALTVPANGLVAGGTQFVLSGGNVGIGTASPAASLSVAGGVQIGNDSICNTSKAGTLRWTGTFLEVCNGTAWANILKGATSGGTVLEAGGFRIHTFLASGTFAATGAVTADVLVVGGGGAGGSNNGGGGGGGGVRIVPGHVLAAGTYPVTVGAGAPAIAANNLGASGTQGQPSSFSTITALGGGGGTGGNAGCGTTGGSGGGDARGRCGAMAGTPGQGNAGAANPITSVGGGGGGAGAAGSTRNGGAGVSTDISGVTTFYGGGGGGGAEDGSAFGGSGGTGGGGQGGGTSRRNGLDGTPNTGGGGGGDVNGNAATGAGGSGIVIIRVPL
jgi:hypothetical protein